MEIMTLVFALITGDVQWTDLEFEQQVAICSAYLDGDVDLPADIVEECGAVTED